MRFIPFSPFAPDQASLLQTMLNAQPKLVKNESLAGVCAHLAERYLGSAGHPAEPLSISRVGEDQPTTIDFTDILDKPFTPEKRGQAVLERIVERLMPALQRNGADEEAALWAAHQIAAQLGDRQFATLEQTAIQGATGNRMRGEPVSATHIALEPCGEVLVHKATHWAGYVDDTGKTIEFESKGLPVLKFNFVTAFSLSLERADRRIQQAGDGGAGARMVFANADGTKQFALHAKVQRCYLETPDAALKAMLTGRATSLTDILLYGTARILGWAGIYIDPPGPLHDALWERSRPQDPRDVVQQPPLNLLNVATHRVQASYSGTQERDAALALGAYCQSMASRLVTHSHTRALVDAGKVQGERKEKLLANSGEYGADIYRARKTAKEMESRTERMLYVLKSALKTSSGDCLELALLTSVIIQEKAKRVLSAQGFPNADVRTEIYKADEPGDHAFCVMTVRIDPFKYRIAVDPWVQVSMPYDQYVDYVRSLPENDFLRKDTTFSIAETQSKIINSPDYKAEASAVLQYYLLRWRKPQ
ncbi:hypothetical protein AB870_24295 (plasmid) [Pandoraea faecigallinarum]|uniref:Uncharacterized protein n=1 Tax=Pandoraea faecigallinarum TaxID=656179 RepID=A0A0H3WYU8_9BURK|nr:hypothetical protein [Pandoraea faecigallinarum]AKM33319.1 hypothetical protein AB870_24295 [Pandoraea faecigallinarum]